MKISPYLLAWLAGLLAFALLITGVYLLAGLGWALIACAVPLWLLVVVILRGLAYAKYQQKPE